MTFSAIDIESLVVGKELLLVLVGLSVVFVSCFVMGIVSVGRARKIVKTKDDYDDLTRKMANLSAQRDALVAEIQSQGTEREEYVRATKFLEMKPHLVAEAEKLEKAIADKELTLRKLYEQLQGAEKERDELKKISGEIMEMERGKAILDSERKAVERVRDDMRKEIDDGGKKVDALRKEGKELLEKNNALEGEVAKSQKEKESLENSVKQLIQQQKEVERARDDVRKEIDEGGKKVDALKKEGKELLEKNNALEGEIAKSQKTKACLEDSVKQLIQQQKEVERARDDVRKEIDEGGKEVDALKKEGKELLEKKNALEGEVAKSQKEKESLENSVKQLIQQQKSARAWLEDKLRNRDDLNRQIVNAKDELKRLDEKIKDGTKAVADTMARIDKGLDRLNKMNFSGVQILRQNAFASLKEGVFSVPEQRTQPANEDELEALKTVAEHMKSSNFVVPERLLYAFHTSLKTSDMSSLTVMAGVSGTGKSAIPKLYSEAMGIHFQPLAVEPRWDSPKDLLGFFNYVTNRYEPTALARALFQFQGLHGEDFKPDMDMKEYMLMPMLDEMNLARIEYYFSEFLSKLEMRRLVAPLTHENLGIVALEIFQGFSAKGEDGKMVKESPIRLFANQNTLFVGTMNEDETTQSLSDKVIDRANVLYFGRPDRLQAKEGGAGHAISFKPIRKTTWDSWRKNVNEDELKFATVTLGALNRTLADFNRPFAHRTYQAMLSYIANYPVKSEKDRDVVIRRALADQIGMRIMPKLYGVDLALNQDTFEQVRRNLMEVRDPLLLQAFNRASDREQNKSGFFHWTGFDWNGDDNGDDR